MPSKQPFRIYLMLSILLLGMAGVLLQLLNAAGGEEAAAVGVKQGKYHLHIPLTQGVIYDRFMRPLNQTEDRWLAVVSPTEETVEAVFPVLKDRDSFTRQLQSVSPFVCELTEPPAQTPGLTVLPARGDRSGALTAQHLLGYRQENRGAAGLERAFSDVLTACDTSADLTFSVDALGAVLAGDDSETDMNGTPGGGIVTTLDRDIQKITETALQAVRPDPGAAVVLDCRTGDILASASTPVYQPEALADSLDDPQSPFLNRVLCAYNVGSVFKLVIAAAGLEHGFTADFVNDCTGSTEIYGQVFRCHRRSGHGLLDMEQAVIESCNPYFITLSRMLSAADLHHTAELLGFGQRIVLADGIASDSGSLQSAEMLSIDAEKANFSFGQGMLLATPLQICAMTACIANRGIYTEPQLVVGVTADGSSCPGMPDPAQHYALKPETAQQLCGMMQAVLADPEHANGAPFNTTAGGKTSTAQTGHFAADGTEYCHAWMTGFFPADDPHYAVTVLVENGGSGNEAAAPVFRRIIEEMTRAGL